MEQRRLRLGDILDDYCSRERRVTNHVVVAMIEEEVKQTRCTTCDAEHPYKGGREPRRRSKKDAPGALYREVLAGMPDTDPAPGVAAEAATIPAPIPAPALAKEVVTAPAVEVAADEEDETPDADQPRVEEGPVHRRLIRATLPRIEGQQPEPRPVHEFTMRQNNGRGPFRGGGAGRMGAPAAGNGNRPHAPRRFGGGGGGTNGMPGRGQAGRGAGGGFRGPNNNTPRQGGGKKRSR